MNQKFEGNISVDDQPRIVSLMKDTELLQSEVRHLLIKLNDRISCLIVERTLTENDRDDIKPKQHQSEMANRIDIQNDELRSMIDRLNYILNHIEV